MCAASSLANSRRCAPFLSERQSKGRREQGRVQRRVFKRDTERVPVVVAECPSGRSKTLGATREGNRVRSPEPSPEIFDFWWANESFALVNAVPTSGASANLETKPCPQQTRNSERGRTGWFVSDILPRLKSWDSSAILCGADAGEQPERGETRCRIAAML
jgi:hypothetical protein